MDNRAEGFVVRRWSRHLKGWFFVTGLRGCNAWTLDEGFAKVFGTEAAAREWLVGTTAELVPAGRART